MYRRSRFLEPRRKKGRPADLPFSPQPRRGEASLSLDAGITRHESEGFSVAARALGTSASCDLILDALVGGAVDHALLQEVLWGGVGTPAHYGTPDQPSAVELVQLL